MRRLTRHRHTSTLFEFGMLWDLYLRLQGLREPTRVSRDCKPVIQTLDLWLHVSIRNFMFGIIFRFFAYSARGRTVCLILGAHPSKMAVPLPDLKCCSALPDVRRRSRSPRRSKLALPALRSSKLALPALRSSKLALPSLLSSLELPLPPSNSWLCDSLWKPAWSFNYNYQAIGNRHIY